MKDHAKPTAARNLNTRWSLFGKRKAAAGPVLETQVEGASSKATLPAPEDVKVETPAPSAVYEKLRTPRPPSGRKQSRSPDGNSNDDDSVNSKRLQDLHLNDKLKAPNPGQKRSPEDSADDSRRWKQSRSPEATGNIHAYRSINDEKSPAFRAHAASGEEPSTGVGQVSGDVRDSAFGSILDPRGRERNAKNHHRHDRSNSPPEEAWVDDDPPEGDTSMLLQPDTRPITPEQLVNEVKGIYSGLVMVEKKCVEIITQRASTGGKLSNDQWQALIALHRTLLHEHHDFFLASQHPTASPALRRLATKYAMPARMWRNGIHAFLELLRQQLPESYDHMLAFVYIAYSMMALLMESVPSFLETWIECLGDLARYRMAIEEIDMKDREIWSNVARMWYNKAADRSPNVGRIQHHLAVLARPNIVMQLFLYSKALISVVPFPNARESIMLLFGPLLDKDKAEAQYQKYTPVEASLVTAWGLAFTKGSITAYVHHTQLFLSGLDGHISRTTNRFKVQGPEVASSLTAGVLDFGSDENPLWKMFAIQRDAVKTIWEQEQKAADAAKAALTTTSAEPAPVIEKATNTVPQDDFHIKEKRRHEYWKFLADHPTQDLAQAPLSQQHDHDSTFTSPEEVATHSLLVWYKATSIVATKIGDKNTVPYMHTTLAFLWASSFVPGALIYLESYVPWSKLVMFLNTLGRSGVYDAQVESAEFPQTRSGVGRQLPEDFFIRGLIWAAYYYPSDFFTGQVVDEDERQLEMPSHAAPRAERCLWLGARIASLERYISYNVGTKHFSITEYAKALPVIDTTDTFENSPSQKATMTDEPEFDAIMVDV